MREKIHLMKAIKSQRLALTNKLDLWLITRDQILKRLLKRNQRRIDLGNHQNNQRKSLQKKSLWQLMLPEWVPWNPWIKVKWLNLSWAQIYWEAKYLLQKNQKIRRRGNEFKRKERRARREKVLEIMETILKTTHTLTSMMTFKSLIRNFNQPWKLARAQQKSQSHQLNKLHQSNQVKPTLPSSHRKFLLRKREKTLLLPGKRNLLKRKMRDIFNITDFKELKEKKFHLTHPLKSQRQAKLETLRKA